MDGTGVGKMKGKEKAMPGPRKCLDIRVRLRMTTAFAGYIEHMSI